MREFVEIPASKKSLAFRKPLHGVGINDAEYMTTPIVSGKRLICPYYLIWMGMINRCYSRNRQKDRPTYEGCSTTKEWLVFSNFKDWMVNQDWQGKQLDKDILFSGNKEYSPDKCIFVSSQINNLLLDRAASRGDCPQGVTFRDRRGKYEANCKVSGKTKYLGSFSAVNEAELTYLRFKSSLIKDMAFGMEALSNPRLQEGLLRNARVFMNKAYSISNEIGSDEGGH